MTHIMFEVKIETKWVMIPKEDRVWKSVTVSRLKVFSLWLWFGAFVWASQQFWASTSHTNSVVLNSAHVLSRKSRIRCHRAMVTCSSWVNVASVCIRNLASPCHSAIQKSSFMTLLLCGSGSNRSNTGIAHWRRSSKSGPVSFFIADAFVVNQHIVPVLPKVGIWQNLWYRWWH